MKWGSWLPPCLWETHVDTGMEAKAVPVIFCKDVNGSCLHQPPSEWTRYCNMPFHLVLPIWTQCLCCVQCLKGGGGPEGHTQAFSVSCELPDADQMHLPVVPKSLGLPVGVDAGQWGGRSLGSGQSPSAGSVSRG